MLGGYYYCLELTKYFVNLYLIKSMMMTAIIAAITLQLLPLILILKGQSSEIPMCIDSDANPQYYCKYTTLT
jgi:hypothetical protein